MTLHCIYPILLKFMYQTEQILILRCNNHGWQYFRDFAPFLWNNLPVCIRQTESIVHYKKRLKLIFLLNIWVKGFYFYFCIQF